ncbi:MAG: RNA methyltransferase [Bacteroidales bacterium]|jgi:TrmH family RNA methyltransferase|nr:RNA methyltransferase [Bacteroidales bacterium]
MLSRSQIKHINSLYTKNARNDAKLFPVEGDKLVVEALQSGFVVETLFATGDFLCAHPAPHAREVIEITAADLQRISRMQTPQHALALVRMRRPVFDIRRLTDQLMLALDCVQDPGNMGAIIRIADWFGLRHIISSPDSADCYNPKVVQATMGSVFRVQVCTMPLSSLLDAAVSAGIPVYGAFLTGANIYCTPLSPNGILVMGNEGNGISPAIAGLIPHRLLIPSFTGTMAGPESLNVAMATAVCCSEFRRRLP